MDGTLSIAMRAAHRLAVNRDDFAGQGRKRMAHPAYEACLELTRVEGLKHASKRVM